MDLANASAILPKQSKFAQMHQVSSAPSWLRSNGLLWSLLLVLFNGLLGCATWLPSGEQPRPIEKGLKSPPLSDESVAIETIVLRLNADQQIRLEEFWNSTDQQILAPELRIDLDRNGVRVGKISGSLPSVLEKWMQETGLRAEADSLENTGVTADVQNVARHWRCRAGSKKEIPLRDLTSEKITLFYHDQGLKGRALDRPRIYYSMSAVPGRDQTAMVSLTPEIEHGEVQKRFIVSDVALRPVSERERLSLGSLTIPMKMQRGDSLVIGPTSDRRGVGAEVLHSCTADYKYEPVIMIVRLAQSGVDSVFENDSNGLSQR